jgi:superfamily II DNA or RNA helicase
MEIVHNQLQWIRNQVDFSTTKDIQSLIKEIIDASKKFNSQKEQDKLKGDAFEIFVEYFIKSFGNSNQVGIVDYKPNTDLEFEDLGVDGLGYDIGVGDIATVQAKFRSNPKELVTHEEASKFFMQSVGHYKVPPGNIKNLLIITTAFGITEPAKALYGAMGGRVIGLDDLKIIIGPSNLNFWDGFREALNNSQKERIREIKERRPHQKSMVEKGLALLNDSSIHRGWFSCGTGGGKTFVINDLAELWLNEHNIVVIASPRIRLTEQIKGVMHSQKRLDYQRITFHSGGKEELERFQSDTTEFLGNSTTSEEILKQWLTTHKGKKIIIYTTYHSSLKLGSILEKEERKDYLYLADECHNLVTVEFSNIVRTMLFKKFLAFTGTPNETRDANGSGMNNRLLWGSCLQEVSAMELASNGITVPPRMFVVKVADDNHDAEQFEIDIVNRAIRKFKDDICAHTGCKVIVTCSSVRIAHKMADFNLLKDLPEFERCVVTSDRTKMSGRTIDQELKKFARSENAIVFHYDMLGEGIDVPAVTAVLPMRSLNTIKAIQTIGRANRLTDEDKHRLIEGTIEIHDRQNWNKPYAWLITPYVEADPYSQEAYRNMLSVLRMLRKQEGDELFVEEYLHIAEPDPNENELKAPNYNEIRKQIEQLVAQDLAFELETEEAALTMLRKAKATNLVEVNYTPSEDDYKYANEIGSPCTF